MPWWFDRLLAAALSLLLGYGLVGWLLAAIGFFSPGAVVLVGLAASFSIYTVWTSPVWAGDEERHSAGSAPAAVLVALVLVWVGFNAVYSAQWVLPDGEQGRIVVAARSLADSGDLDAPVQVPGLDDPALSFDLPGYSLGEDGRARPDVPRLTTVLAATLAWGGDDWLVRGGAVLGGAALLALYGLAARLLRPWTAVVMVAGLAVSLPWLQFGRTPSSPAVVVVLVAGGLGLLAEHRLDPIRGALAGALLAGPALDSPFWLLLTVPLAAVAGVEWRSAASGPWTTAQAVYRFLAGFATGAGLVLAGGAVLAVGWSPAALLAFPVAALALLAARFVPAPSDRAGAMAAAVLVVAVAAGFTLVRPIDRSGQGEASDGPQRVVVFETQQVAAAQLADAVKVETDRTYAERSLRWAGWYLGWQTLLAGVVGLALLAAAAVAGAAARAGPTLLVLGAAAVAALWAPGGHGVQIVGTGRVLAVVFPLLLLGTGWLVDRIFDRRPVLEEVFQTAAIALALAVVAVPAWLAADLWDDAHQVGAMESIDMVCDRVGADDVVIVVDAGEGYLPALPPAIRSFCERPAALLAAPPEAADAAVAESVAAALEPGGRRLVVISAVPEPFGPAAGLRGRPVAELRLESVEARVEGRPRRVVEIGAQLYSVVVDPPG